MALWKKAKARNITSEEKEKLHEQYWSQLDDKSLEYITSQRAFDVDLAKYRDAIQHLAPRPREQDSQQYSNSSSTTDKTYPHSSKTHYYPRTKNQSQLSMYPAKKTC